MDRTEREIRAARAEVSRDAAGIGPHARPGVQLKSLRELDDLRVAEGDADIRGWEVRTLGGRELGRVADLLVDTAAHEVVMLDVDLAGSDRHTLAPVRAAQIDRARRVVLIDSADLEDASAVPSLRRTGAATDDETRDFGQRYQKAYGERGWDRDRDWQVARGDHDLEFRRREPGDEHALPLAAGGPADTGATEVQRALDAERERETLQNAARRKAEREEREHREADRHAREASVSAGESRDLRFAPGAQRAAGQDEIVVERRPVIEEVVIRRRVVDPDSPEARNLGASGSQAGDADRTR